MATDYTTPGSPRAFGEVWASFFQPVNSLHPLTAEDGSRILGILRDGPVDPREEFDVALRDEVELFVGLVRLGATGMTPDELQAAHVSFNEHAGIDGEDAND